MANSGGLGNRAALFAGTQARAMTLARVNLVNLIRDSDAIMIGNVYSVTDGIDEPGFPYTEVTVAVDEALRGAQSSVYVFRQIGLMNPRPTADGTKIVPAAPEGIPRYSQGEHVLLFVGTAASMTGLRTTTGLGHGKFVLGAGSAENDLGNQGVFQNVSVLDSLLTSNDQRILGTTAGAVNPDDLLSLVRRAVSQNWLGNCQMWETDQGQPTCMPKRPIQPKSTLTLKSGTSATGSAQVSGN